MKLSRYASQFLAAWCGLCALGFFALAAWMDHKLSKFTPYEPPAELTSTIETTENIEFLRSMALRSVQEGAFATNQEQVALPVKAFVSLALSAGGAFMLTAAFALGPKREKEAKE